ncbi:MAG: hypothetical protein HYZ53_00525 [Planctomycetes bacterium]|nr:hypothetical protein [Planctomycetota bacterium]
MTLERSKQLLGEGYALVEAGDFEGALRIAEQLEAVRFTGAFELAASARAGSGHLADAITVLERGVAAAPGAWLNWQLLGNYRSDLEKYGEAAAAYEQALACDGCWVASVRLNQAILLSRQGEDEVAIRILDGVGDEALRTQVSAVRSGALLRLRRFAEALAVAVPALDDAAEDANVDDLDRLIANVGWARLGMGESSGDVRRHTMAWLSQRDAGREVFSLIRELDGRYSESARYLRLLVHGTLETESARAYEAVGFYVTVDVVADDVEEALKYVRAIETVAVESLLVEEVEDLEPRPVSPKGVYRKSSYQFYKNDD